MKTFWAKLSDDRKRVHPLHAHSADVAAVMERLLLPDSVLSARVATALGTDELLPFHRCACVYLAALHDIGKTNHGFQEQASRQPRFRRRGHVKVLLESGACAPLKSAIIDALQPLGLRSRDAEEMFATTVAHHGRPWATRVNPAWNALWLPAKGIERDPVAEIRRIAALALNWSGLDHETPAALHASPAFTHLFAGALTLADWIGSTEDAFPFTPDADPVTYWESARLRATDACERIGVVGRSLDDLPDGLPLLRRLFPGVFARHAAPNPTALQAHLAEAPLPPPGARVLVESETGSGKTEAALTLYARLRARGDVGGLMFALPTRATAKAMHDRVTNALPGVYGQRLPTVSLAVGGAHPHASSGAPLLRHEPLRCDDPEDTGADPLARWASDRAKRFLAAEIVVGTLDQLLLGALPVRHAHLRLAALTRHLLVIDELHSYDRYMGEVLSRLLALHTAHGGIVLFMSATLSDAARRAFGEGNDPVTSAAEAVASPYPAVSVCLREGRWTSTPMSSAKILAPKHVHWGVCGEDGWMHHAVDAARSGARVCVLRNTVRGARASVATLAAAGHTALLWQPRSGATPAYHSRYALPDRLALDGDVVGRFGRGNAGVSTILVATQVAEQSLDLDFDLLITDLCPVDVLLQRIGRLWRHADRLSRPGCQSARAWVIVPGHGLEEYIPRHESARPNGWGNVYANLGDLQFTRRLVEDERVVRIPNDNRRLVEAVYHPDAREVLWGDAVWQAYLDKMEGTVFGEAIHARQAAIPFDETYAACAGRFSAAEETVVRTRLGDEQVRVELGRDVSCRYVPQFVDHLELPHRVFARIQVEIGALTPTEWRADDNGVSFRLGRLQVAYGDQGWEWKTATG